MHFISVWYSKTIVFVEHYRLDLDFFLSISANLSRKRFRKGDWEVIERRHCMLR